MPTATLRCRRPGRTGRLPGQRRLALLLGHDVQARPYRRLDARTAADHGGQHLTVQALLHTTVSDGRNREIHTSMTAWPPTHPPPHSCRPGRRRVWVLLVRQEGVLSCLPVADSRLPTHRYAMDMNQSEAACGLALRPSASSPRSLLGQPYRWREDARRQIDRLFFCRQVRRSITESSYRRARLRPVLWARHSGDCGPARATGCAGSGARRPPRRPARRFPAGSGQRGRARKRREGPGGPGSAGAARPPATCSCRASWSASAGPASNCSRRPARLSHHHVTDRNPA